ncbi:MAG: hypothetical protein J5799_03995 [Bacteroidales bacterium]|nr:hypothetical protein [Bacteroidales bacterium]
MSRGKSTCKVLKEVRRKIADTNGIPLEERECTHQGDCAGTCPYCEAEVRYLERELSKRKSFIDNMPRWTLNPKKSKPEYIVGQKYSRRILQ